MTLIHDFYIKNNKINEEKYKAKKVNITNKKRAKYHDIDMEVDVNILNSIKQHKDVDMQKASTFFPHIEIENKFIMFKTIPQFHEKCFIYI